MPQDTTHLCPSCFKPTNPSPICPDCKTDSSLRRSAGVLPLWTRLYVEGRYLIGRVLGQGGFGVTYAAWDETMQQVVAVKELYLRHNVARATDSVRVEPDTENDAVLFSDARTKFLEETRLLARPSLKSNPGIISVENFFEVNGTAYMVMEYLEGQTLEDYVAFMGGKLPPENADLMMAGVLDALHAVHQERLSDDSIMIHRDIKPENVYVTDGPWTDVYAAGATWYRLVTGQKPEEAFLRSTEETDPLMPPSGRGLAVTAHTEATWLKALAEPPEEAAVVSVVKVADIKPDPVIPPETEPDPPTPEPVRNEIAAGTPQRVEPGKTSGRSNMAYVLGMGAFGNTAPTRTATLCVWWLSRTVITARCA